MIHGRALSTLLLLLVMLIWGSTYAVTKAGLGELPPMLFALLRFVVTSAVLVPLALFRGGLARLPRPAPWTTLGWMGLTGVGLYYAAFNLSLSYTSAAQGALIQASIPAVTAMMAVAWLGERLSPRRWIGIALAVAGVLLIVSRSPADGSARSALLGNLLMFGSVVAWGAYTMLAKRVAGADAAAITACVAALGTLTLVPFALFEAAGRPAPSIGLSNWLRIAYLGVFPSALGYLLYSRALRDLEASQVGTFVNLVPVVGVAASMVLLGETVSPLAVAGGALVLAGVWLSSSERP